MRKKVSLLAAAAAACVTLSSCGFGSAGAAKSASGAASSAQTTASLINNVLTHIVNNSSASEQSIQGTWTYASPKVVFESESILSQLGGAMASNKIETALSSQLAKYGFDKGKTQLTLNSDKTCSMTLNGRTTPGTYSYDSKSKKLSITGALGLQTMTCTASIYDGQLMMLFDADKILSIANSLGSKSNSSLSSLTQNYKGLKWGWSMSK